MVLVAITFPDEFLYQFRPRDTDEGTVGMVSHSPSQQGLPGARGPIEQHSLEGSRGQGWERLVMAGPAEAAAGETQISGCSHILDFRLTTVNGPQMNLGRKKVPLLC